MKGYNQHLYIDLNEIDACVARLKAKRMLLTFFCIMNFKFLKMDGKSAFLNSYIQEEVYIDQPFDFKIFSYPNHVFKVKRLFIV